MKALLTAAVLTLLLVAAGCSHNSDPLATAERIPVSGKTKLVIDDALDQTHHTVRYDPAYVRIDYPGGDIPIERGVCSDVVVRAFRKSGVDLQKNVHEDMMRNFSAYPQRWGLTEPDANIDHRRVPNLMKYFERMGKAKAITYNTNDYQPGDIVVWDMGGGLSHIGLISNLRSASSGKLMTIHNIGRGAQIDDRLFDWKIIGHYRYF